MLKNKNSIATWGLWFIALTAMFYMLPKAGDDWIFYTPAGVEGLWEKSVSYYLNENGRILGNFFVHLFADYLLAGSIFKAGIVFGISYLMWRAISIKFKGIVSIIIIACLWLPGSGSVFAQTYAWSAGFYNYVPPALFFMISFILLTEQFKKKELKSNVGTLSIYGLVGFLGQFFAEFYTTYVSMFAVFLIIIYWYINKKISKPMLAYAIGAFLGAAVMFLSPVYRRVAANQDHYRTVSLSIKELLNTAKSNYVDISKNLIRENYWVIILLSFCCILLLFKGGQLYRKWGDGIRNIIVFGLTSVPCYYILASRILVPQFTLNSSFKIYIDFVISVAYFLIVGIVCLFEVKDTIIKWRCIYLMISFVVLIAPLFFVTPVGARCYYVLYMSIALTAILLLSYLVKAGLINTEYLVIPLFTIVLISIFAIEVIAFYQKKVNDEKCAFIEEELKRGEAIIEVPRFLYPQYIHEPETEKISYQYYIKKPWDVKWKYISYDEWHNKYN